MNRLLDKLLLFTLCMALYLNHVHGTYLIVPILVCVILSAGNSLIPAAVFRQAAFIAMCLVSFAAPALIYFLPLFYFDSIQPHREWLGLIGVAVICANIRTVPVPASVTTGVLLLLALLMTARMRSMESLQERYIQFKDDATEYSMNLQEKNRELMEKQDYEINLATLNERNRIARDIHDSVGHLLSSSILQIGAMMAVCRDEPTRERLNTLKTTLSQGMDSIRSSVHNLYDESVDLYAETQKMIRAFAFCPIRLQYEIGTSPEKKIKYAFLSVLKECLSNIIRHSNATRVTVTMREHPALYQLIVEDNGMKKTRSHENGIGLQNIQERIGNLGGRVHISDTDGFVVFVSVPKEME